MSERMEFDNMTIDQIAELKKSMEETLGAAITMVLGQYHKEYDFPLPEIKVNKQKSYWFGAREGVSVEYVAKIKFLNEEL